MVQGHSAVAKLSSKVMTLSHAHCLPQVPVFLGRVLQCRAGRSVAMSHEHAAEAPGAMLSMSDANWNAPSGLNATRANYRTQSGMNGRQLPNSC